MTENKYKVKPVKPVLNIQENQKKYNGNLKKVWK